MGKLPRGAHVEKLPGPRGHMWGNYQGGTYGEIAKGGTYGEIAEGGARGEGRWFYSTGVMTSGPIRGAGKCILSEGKAPLAPLSYPPVQCLYTDIIMH